MADRNDDNYEGSDSGEGVEKHDPKTGKPKKKWRDRIKRHVGISNKVSADQGSTTGDGHKGKGSRKTSRDSSASDTSSPRQVPPAPIKEHQIDSHRTELLVASPVHGGYNPSFPHGRNSSPISTQPHASLVPSNSAQIVGGRGPEYDHLPPRLTSQQDCEYLIQGQNQAQFSGGSARTVPEKSKDQPLSDLERKLMQEIEYLTKQIKEMENSNHQLRAENSMRANQLTAEKEERRKDKEAATRAIDYVEKVSTQEKVKLEQEKERLEQEKQRLVQELETKSEENDNLVQQLPAKEIRAKQLEDKVVQREKEMYAMHLKMKEVNENSEKQLQKAQKDLEFSCSEVASLRHQVAKLQESHQNVQKVQELEANLKEKEEHIQQLIKSNKVLLKQLDDANTETRKKAVEIDSNKKVTAEAEQARVQTAALLEQEKKHSQDLSRRFAKESLQVTRLQEELKQKEEQLQTTVENMKKEIATLSARLEVRAPISMGSLRGGANASSGPSSFEEEQKKVVLLEDSMKANDEELQWLRQEKVALECELRDERVAKNQLEAEKARLTAKLQAEPDYTALTAQIAEYEKELQHVHVLTGAVQPPHSPHILQQMKDKIHHLEHALKKEKEERERALQEKVDAVCKLEQDLRESQKELERKQQTPENVVARRLQKRNTELEEELKKEKENMRNLLEQKSQLTAQLHKLETSCQKALLNQKKAEDELEQLRASNKFWQKKSGAEEAAYKREMELYEETTQNLDKARKTATEYQRLAHHHETEMAQVRQQLEGAKLQLQQTQQQLFQVNAEKESLERRIQHIMVAKDQAIADMKLETNDIRIQMQKKFERVSAELASTTECVNSKQGRIERLEARVEQLTDDLGTSQAKAQIYQDDFAEERKDRERIKGEMVEVKEELEKSKASVADLESTVNELKTQNQHLRDQIERSLKENRRQEEKLEEVSKTKKELRNEVATLNEELQTTRAQIRGYKTQSDGFRMQRDDLEKRQQETEEVLQQTLQQAQEYQEKITQLQKQLDSEKKDHEHLLGAFKKLTAIKDELFVRTLHMEENLKTLQHQNAKLTEYQARHEAKVYKARQALAHHDTQPLPHSVVASANPLPARIGYDMERGSNFEAHQVSPGHGGAAAVSRSNQVHNNQGYSSNFGHQFQHGQSQPYPHPPQQPQQSPLHRQDVHFTSQEYDKSAGPSSLGNAGRANPNIGHAYMGQNVPSSNHPVPHPTQASDSSPCLDQAVFQSHLNAKVFPSHAPQHGHTNASASMHPKGPALSNVQSNVQLSANQQANPGDQGHHQIPGQKGSVSQSRRRPSDDQASVPENPLIDNIDQDIAEVAGEVREMSGQPSTIQRSLRRDQQLPQGEQGFEIPRDPNLVCSKCGYVFGHGEIQKLRKHYEQCNGRR